MNKNIKTALIIGSIIVAILIIVPLIFGLIGGWQGYGYGFGMMGPWMMGGGWRNVVYANINDYLLGARYLGGGSSGAGSE